MFRAMTRSGQQLSDAECIAILQQAPRGVLSVLGDGGYPYGLPINFWYCGEDGKLYFHSGKTGHKIDAIQNCDKVSFCVYDEGFCKEGDWALTIRSVILFGRVEIIQDQEAAMEISRRLSYKYTSDAEYIEHEITHFGHEVLCFALMSEHMSGKIVHEA